jgi:acetyl-CoA carboxylase biotin carboxylase subunit
VVTGYGQGSSVTPYYDPMIAQVIVSQKDRVTTLKVMAEVLAEFEIEGLKTNIPFLRLMMEFQPYMTGDLHTGLAEKLISSEGYKDLLDFNSRLRSRSGQESNTQQESTQ